MSQPSAPQRSGTNPILLAVIAALIVAAVAAVVIVAAGGDDDDETDTATNGAAGANGVDFDFDTANAEVDGAALPPFPESGDDPAIGMDAPVVTGFAPDGTELTTPAEGRPTMLLFLAHWCPHCQIEITTAHDWIEDGNLSEDVDLSAVATAIDPTRANHPPSAWFEDEDWSQPSIADADTAVGQAYGLSQFPYWVIVDADGKVVDRRAGEQTEPDFEEMMNLALGK